MTIKLVTHVTHSIDCIEDLGGVKIEPSINWKNCWKPKRKNVGNQQPSFTEE